MKLNSTQLMVTAQVCALLVGLSAIVALVVSNVTDTPVANTLYVAILPVCGLIAVSLVAMRISHRIKVGTESILEATASQVQPLISGGDQPAVGGRDVAPIEVAGSDEFSQVGTALEGVRVELAAAAVHRSTELEEGVSELLTVLARRNGRVADQQIALLESFDEASDPSAAMENHPKLVHLANRMRRNADGLLVLARSERPSTARSSAIDDVVRDAISEIEEYQRIDVLALDLVSIAGSAVSDLAHLLAELLDNAAAFSAPSTRVRVAGSHVDSGYELVVADYGIGLSESRIESLNAELSRPPEVALSIGSTLGLTVVALLADKLGATVELKSLEAGTAAIVRVPVTVLQS